KDLVQKGEFWPGHAVVRLHPLFVPKIDHCHCGGDDGQHDGVPVTIRPPKLWHRWEIHAVPASDKSSWSGNERDHRENLDHLIGLIRRYVKINLEDSRKRIAVSLGQLANVVQGIVY